MISSVMNELNGQHSHNNGAMHPHSQMHGSMNGGGGGGGGGSGSGDESKKKSECQICESFLFYYSFLFQFFKTQQKQNKKYIEIVSISCIKSASSDVKGEPL